MTNNQIAILNNWDQYKKAYEDKFKEAPKSWFGYQRWLADKHLAHNFEPAETEYTKSVMGVE
jgi:hypothetical protein